MRMVSAQIIAAVGLGLYPGLAAGQDAAGTPPPAIRDGVLDGAGRGAAVGALAGVALALAQLASCDRGCNRGSAGGLLLGWALLGAGAGATVGVAADYDASGAAQGRPVVAVGIGPEWTMPRSPRLTGRAAAPAVTASVQLSPHISARLEYARLSARFEAAPGAVPDEVLRHVVEAAARRAGRSHGVESRRISYLLTPLVGIHPPALGRLQVVLLAGLGVQGEEQRDYYDAHADAGSGRTEPLPGQYYVLDFGVPELGWVCGGDAEVAAWRGLRVVPGVRVRAFGASSTWSYGASVQWRF